MTVDGLKPGTAYVFRVRAHTDGGYGVYGGEIELETSHEGERPLDAPCYPVTPPPPQFLCLSPVTHSLSNHQSISLGNESLA